MEPNSPWRWEKWRSLFCWGAYKLLWHHIQCSKTETWRQWGRLWQVPRRERWRGSSKRTRFADNAIGQLRHGRQKTKKMSLEKKNKKIFVYWNIRQSLTPGAGMVPLFLRTFTDKPQSSKTKLKILYYVDLINIRSLSVSSLSSSCSSSNSISWYNDIMYIECWLGNKKGPTVKTSLKYWTLGAGIPNILSTRV